MERNIQRNFQSYAAKQPPKDTSKMFYCATCHGFLFTSQNNLTAIPSPQAKVNQQLTRYSRVSIISIIPS